MKLSRSKALALILVLFAGTPTHASEEFRQGLEAAARISVDRQHYDTYRLTNFAASLQEKNPRLRTEDLATLMRRLIMDGLATQEVMDVSTMSLNYAALQGVSILSAGRTMSEAFRQPRSAIDLDREINFLRADQYERIRNHVDLTQFTDARRIVQAAMRSKFM